MVDFNDGMTVTMPPANLYKILIFQQRNNTLDAQEWFLKQRLKGANVPIADIVASSKRYFMELYALLKRRMKKEEFEALKKGLTNPDSFEELNEALCRLEDEVYELGLTRIDTRKVYDKNIVEVENIMKGL